MSVLSLLRVALDMVQADADVMGHEALFRVVGHPVAPRSPEDRLIARATRLYLNHGGANENEHSERIAAMKAAVRAEMARSGSLV
jgi:hypothetical protein